MADKPGPEIGQMIPHELNVPEQNNNVQNFEDLIGKKGLVLFFVRSADWCPYCKIQLLDLNNRATEFTDLGYQIATVSYDDVEKLKAFDDRYQISFPMLSDKDSEIIKAFDLINPEYDQDHFAHGVPYPGVFVIYPDKTVGAKYFEDGYKERPDLEIVLQDLR